MTHAALAEGEQLPLRKNPDYVKYWWARFCAVLGSQVTYISFPLLALSIAKNPLEASLVTAITYGTPFLVAVPAGHIADLYPRRNVMLVADLLNAIVYLLVAVLLLQGVLSITLLAVAAGLVSANSSAYAASATAILPTIVGNDQVRRAVSVNDTRDFTIALAAPIFGAALFLQASHLPFIVNGLAFLASALLVSRIRTGRASAAGTGTRARGFSTAFEGMRIVGRDKSLVIALTVLSLLSFVLTLNFFSVIAFFEARGEPVSGGVLVASQALGGLLGGLVAASLGARLRPRLVYLLQGFMWFVTGLSMILWQEVWVTAAVLALTWLITPSMRAVYQSYVAVVVDEAERGRVASAAMLAASTMSPLGVLTAGVLTGRASLAPFYAVCTVATVATLLLLITSGRVRGGFLHAAS